MRYLIKLNFDLEKEKTRPRRMSTGRLDDDDKDLLLLPFEAWIQPDFDWVGRKFVFRTT